MYLSSTALPTSGFTPSYFLGGSAALTARVVQTQVPGGTTVEMDTTVVVTTSVTVSVITLPTVSVTVDTAGRGAVGLATVMVSVVT